MYDGYLSFGGVEIINLQRVMAYLKTYAPKLTLECPVPVGLNTALGHAAYVSPQADLAPWYSLNRPASAGFYGIFPGRIQGFEDSTREVESSQVLGDGGIHTSARYATREVRVKGTAFAASEEAMNDGMAWLREVLAGDACGGTGGLGCVGHQVSTYTSQPITIEEANERRRTFYKAQTIDAPKFSKVNTTKTVVSRYVDFTVEMGKPWAFTNPVLQTTVDLPTGSSFTDPANENCSLLDDPYNDFINDPYFTNIVKPPRPATILPPNVLKVTTWRRRTFALLATVMNRWGRVVPNIRITTSGTSAQHIRIRFYKGTATVSGCAYDGEFWVSYLPANSTLFIDGAKREAYVTLSNGKRVTGMHLLYGSDGRPFMWPSMGCQQNYTMTADIMPGQTGVQLQLETAVRE